MIGRRDADGTPRKQSRKCGRKLVEVEACDLVQLIVDAEARVDLVGGIGDRLDPAAPVGQLDEAHRRPLRGAVPDALALVGVNIRELRVEVPCREFLLDELRRQRLDRELATGARHGLVAHGRHAPILDDRPGAPLEAELDARGPMERPGSQ